MARILYLEDEEWQVAGSVITVMEKELNHEVTLVRSVAEASEALSNARFDAVVLDVWLDVEGTIRFEDSGLLIAEQILDGTYENAGNSPTLPIVFASAYPDATVTDGTGKDSLVLDRARALGINGERFLRKPFLVEELIQLLDKVLKSEDVK